MKKTLLKMLWLLLIIITITSCKTKTELYERVVFVKDLKRYCPDTCKGYTSVDILESYPVNKDCSYLRHYFNLYICKTRLTNKVDTVYIFDECNNPTFSVNNSKAGIEVGFFVSDTPTYKPKQAIILVPNTFLIPPNVKCLFGKLTYFAEY